MWKGEVKSLPPFTTETGAEYRAKNREIKSRNRQVKFQVRIRFSTRNQAVFKPSCQKQSDLKKQREIKFFQVFQKRQV